MQIFGLIFLAGAALLGGVAVFLGVVVLITSGTSGAISWSYAVEGRTIAETVTRAADPGRFWQLYGLLGALPAVAGAVAVWLGVRGLRRGA